MRLLRRVITETKQGFDSELTYKFRDGHGGYTKYNGNGGKTALDPEDDVAHVKCGGSWRMPTSDEISELIENCTWTWASVNGEIGFGNCLSVPSARNF